MSDLLRWGAPLFLAGRPLARFKIHDAPSGNLQSFAFQKLTLKGNIRFAKQQRASGAHNAMPRDAAATWTGGHSAPSGSRATRQFRRSCNRAVGGDSPARNFFH